MLLFNFKHLLLNNNHNNKIFSEEVRVRVTAVRLGITDRDKDRGVKVKLSKLS